MVSCTMDEKLETILKNSPAPVGYKSLWDVYVENPSTATILFRNPNSAAVYWKVQEYGRTKAWEDLLERRVADAKEVAQDRMAAVARAEEALRKFHNP